MSVFLSFQYFWPRATSICTLKLCNTNAGKAKVCVLSGKLRSSAMCGPAQTIGRTYGFAGLTGSSLFDRNHIAPPRITAPPTPITTGEFKYPPWPPGYVPAPDFFPFFFSLG